MNQSPTHKTMRVFLLIWFGQLVSLIGSGTSGFALGVWMYQRSGSVTQLAAIALCSSLPIVVVSPLAGVLVDRWNRRWVMILSDFGAGLSTFAIALLFFTDHLDFLPICWLTTVSSTFGAFQSPAYTAAMSQLVPKQHLIRASSLVQMAGSANQITAPILGGILLTAVQLQGVILLDLATFLISLLTLLWVRFPDLPSCSTDQLKTSPLHEAAFGWTYIVARPGLLGLLIFSTLRIFLLSLFGILMEPWVLSFASPTVLGTVLSISGIGMLAGTVLVGSLGGFKRLVSSLLSFVLLGGLSMAVAGIRPSIPLFTLAIFLLFFSLPIAQTCSQVIWQQKTPLQIQGRVFATKSMILGASVPLAFLVAGPLADFWFQALTTTGGRFASSLSQLIGDGAVHSFGLLFVLLGVLTILLAIAAYYYYPLRYVEDELPDAAGNEATV